MRVQMYNYFRNEKNFIIFQFFPLGLDKFALLKQ